MFFCVILLNSSQVWNSKILLFYWAPFKSGLVFFTLTQQKRVLLNLALLYLDFNTCTENTSKNIRNQKDSDPIVASSGKLSMSQCMHPDSSILQSSSGLPKFIMRKRLENMNRQRQLLFNSGYLKNSWTIPKPPDFSDRRCYIADFFGQRNQMAPFGILQELEVRIPIGKADGFTTNMKLHILVQGEEMFYMYY